MTLPLRLSQSYLSIDKDKLCLSTSYSNKEIAKSIPGRRWNPERKWWEYPLRPEIFEQIIANFPGIIVAPKASLAVSRIAVREALAAEIKAKGWEDAEPIEPMPIKTKPFRHQVAAYNFVCELLGVFD